MLDQGHRFDQNIAAANQRFFILNERFPYFSCGLMLCISGVDDGQEGRRIYKNTHEFNASRK
jgi:hypothetical protein